MGVYEELSIPSDSHQVQHIADNGIRISALNSTQDANKAIDNDGGGYTVQIAHETTSLSRKLYDTVVLLKDEDGEYAAVLSSPGGIAIRLTQHPRHRSRYQQQRRTSHEHMHAHRAALRTPYDVGGPNITATRLHPQRGQRRRSASRPGGKSLPRVATSVSK
jgi:hypothetical protein